MYSLEEKLRIEGVNKIACSPDGKSAAYFSIEHGLNILDLGSRELTRIDTSFLTTPSSIEQLSFASNNMLFLSATHTQHIRRYLIPLAKNQIQRELTADDYLNSLLDPVIAVRIETTTNTLIILCSNYCILKNLNTQRESRWEFSPTILNATHKLLHCWNQEATLLAITTQEGIAIINSLTSKTIKTISIVMKAAGEGLHPLTFSADGKYLLIHNRLTYCLEIWELKAGVCRHRLPIANTENLSLTLLSAGTQVLYATADKYFCWDIASEPQLLVSSIPHTNGRIVSANYATNDFIVLDGCVAKLFCLQGGTMLSRKRAATTLSDGGYGPSLDLPASQILARTISDPGQTHQLPSTQSLRRSYSAGRLTIPPVNVSTPSSLIIDTSPPTVAPTVNLSPLASFIQQAYSGCYGTNADDILAIIKQRFSAELMMEPSLPEHWQLQFLYICVSEIYLQADCRRTNCHRLQLPRKHSVIDHLKKIFFRWVILKYTPIGLPDLTRENSDYFRMIRFSDFILDNKAEDAADRNTVLGSMLATLFPFITDAQGKLKYDICGLTKRSYLTLHQHFSHPYVRLGGILRRPYFALDCHNFDMRGVDLHGSRGYDTEYEEYSFAYMTPSIRDPSLVEHHADFCNADLRYANLICTRFCLPQAFDSTRLDFANVQNSNILMLQQLNETQRQQLLTIPDEIDGLVSDSKNFLVRALSCNLM